MQAPFNPPASYQRKGEEAKRLRVTTRSLDNWMSSGRIPFIKMGRVVLFDSAKVDAALERFEHHAK